MKINRKLKIIKTSDGSHSICDTLNDEIYHSRFGAIQESLHIFINNGFKKCKNKNIKILEVGLGTGLNGSSKGAYGRKFTALAVFLLSKLETGFSGNFTVWPKSHTFFQKYFEIECLHKLK